MALERTTRRRRVTREPGSECLPDRCVEAQPPEEARRRCRLEFRRTPPRRICLLRRLILRRRIWRPPGDRKAIVRAHAIERCFAVTSGRIEVRGARLPVVWVVADVQPDRTDNRCQAYTDPRRNPETTEGLLYPGPASGPHLPRVRKERDLQPLGDVRTRHAKLDVADDDAVTAH